MTCPCHGHNPSSTLGVGVYNIERSEILFLREALTKDDDSFPRVSTERFHECQKIFNCNEWGRELGVGIAQKCLNPFNPLKDLWN